MELRRIWEIFWRRKWIAIQAFFVIALTAGIGSLLATPLYQASGKVLIKKVENPLSRVSDFFMSSVSSFTPLSEDTSASVALAKSRPVLDQVVKRLQLRDGRGELIRAEKLLKENFLSGLFVKRYIDIPPIKKDVEILEIKAYSPDPEEAMMIANTLADVLIDETRRATREEYRSASLFIDEQIDSVKEQYTRASEDMKTFREREKTVDLGLEIRVAIEKIAELYKKKEDIIVDTATAQAKLDTLKRQLGQQRGEFLSSATLADHPVIRELSSRLASLELQLTDALSKFTEQEPRVISLRKQIALVKEQLQKEIRTHQSMAGGIEELERQIAGLKAHLQGSNADIEKYVPLLYTLPEKAANQARLELALTVSQKVYSSLLDYRYRIGVAEAMVLSNLRVLDPATVPPQMYSPSLILNAVLGVVLGLMVGAGLAFALEYLDDTLKTPEDLKQYEPLALLGTIPRFRDSSSPLLTGRASGDPIYEAYRSMRHNLKFASPDRPLKSLLITSPFMGEGKTITAINLGISMSREGNKVLIMDTDLRRPALHVYFQRSPVPGITNILVGESGMQEAIFATEVEGLSLLFSGTPPPDPGQFVESKKLQQLVEELTQQFDLVILDSPPVLAVVDALILARYTDGCLTLMESGKATRQAASAMHDVLAKAKIQPVGLVLNKLRAEWQGYYYSSYYYHPNGRGTPKRLRSGG